MQDEGERTEQSKKDFPVASSAAGEAAMEEDAFQQQLQQWRVTPSSKDRHRKPKFQCVGLFLSFMFCFVFFCFALLCFALLCFALLCFALLCFALLCFALLCFALLSLVCLLAVTSVG